MRLAWTSPPLGPGGHILKVPRQTLARLPWTWRCAGLAAAISSPSIPRSEPTWPKAAKHAADGFSPPGHESVGAGLTTTPEHPQPLHQHAGYAGQPFLHVLWANH